VFVAIAYASRLTYQEQLRQLETETYTMATTVVAFVNQNFVAADAIARTASGHPKVVGLDPDASEVLRPLVGRLLRNAFLADAAGSPTVWAVDPDPKLDGSVPRAWLEHVIASGAAAVSPMLGGPDDPGHAVVLAYPILESGRAKGVLGLVVQLEALERLLRAIPLPAGSVVTLTDEKSVVVARSLDAARYVGRPVEVGSAALAPASVPASVIRTGVDGVERVFGNAVVERGPWLASVGIPTALGWSRTVPIYYRNYAISVVGVVLVLVISMFAVRRWLGSFEFLGKTADRVAKGDLSALERRRMPTAELEQLQNSLADMITKLRESRHAIDLQVAEERRIRHELQSLQQQVIRQERLAAIGVLVSGVAHELNNPLQAILGFAELLQMQQGLPDQARSDLTLIQKESARASAIIRNLSRFGRQKSDPAPVRLTDVVASVFELRQRNLEELGIQLDVDERSRASVMAVFTELQQVLLNLVINAEQAILYSQAAERRIVIRTADVGGRARLEVEDSGPGVAPENEARIFQPFYTTKPVGEGTGLGLSVSYGIIQSHGGQIGYRRAQSGGALFWFELPTASPGDINAFKDDDAS
jgi:signal transduction histidine kinase